MAVVVIADGPEEGRVFNLHPAPEVLSIPNLATGGYSVYAKAETKWPETSEAGGEFVYRLREKHAPDRAETREEG